MTENKPLRSKSKEYFADLSLYTMMAYYVAKVLRQRPNDILDTWCVPELIVTFGQYANEESHRNFKEWKSLDSQTRAKNQKPDEYIVYFHNIDEE